MWGGALLVFAGSLTSAVEDVNVYRASTPLPGSDVTLSIEDISFKSGAAGGVQRLAISRLGKPDVEVPLRLRYYGDNSTELYQLAADRFAVVTTADCVLVRTSMPKVSSCWLEPESDLPANQLCMARLDERGVLKQAGSGAVYLGEFSWRNGAYAEGGWGYGLFFVAGDGPRDAAPPHDCESSPGKEGAFIARAIREAASGMVEMKFPTEFISEADRSALRSFALTEMHDAAFAAYAGNDDRVAEDEDILAGFVRNFAELKLVGAGGDSPDVALVASIAMPQPETYRVTLEATVGASRGAWSITRDFDAIGRVTSDSGAPSTADVRFAIRSDLSKLGVAACSAILKRSCVDPDPG